MAVAARLLRRPAAALCVATLVTPALHGAERSFELALGDSGRPGGPLVLRATQGDAVRLRLTAREPGVMHLHALRLEARVTPDAPQDLRFTANAAGRFRLEWHAEGAKASGHHAAPAAVLEVQPR